MSQTVVPISALKAQASQLLRILIDINLPTSSLGV